MHRVLQLSRQLCSSEEAKAASEPLVLYRKLERVALLTLNRPRALNALSAGLMKALAAAVDEAEADPDIGCIVLTGAGKAFVAGADIKEMQGKRFSDLALEDWIGPIDRIQRCRIPVIAAVNGFALGGGCELAMMCDILWAAENAVFGQPEIKIGAIPGAGGTQRLPRAVGKSKAMEMVLSGNSISADEALRIGLVSKVVKGPPGEVVKEALAFAKEIAKKSKPLILLAKECVLSSREMHETQGVKFERRVFHSVFGLQDQKEGMAAFVEKRKPNFTHA